MNDTVCSANVPVVKLKYAPQARVAASGPPELLLFFQQAGLQQPFADPTLPQSEEGPQPAVVAHADKCKYGCKCPTVPSREAHFLPQPCHAPLARAGGRQAPC